MRSKSLILAALSLSTATSICSALTNASFESGLAGWSSDISTYAIGNSGFPIGVDGVSVANLGTFDQSGSFLSQNFSPKPGKNFVRFALGANSPNSGLVAAVKVTVSQQNGNVIATDIFSVESLGFLDRDAGFETKKLKFVAPGNSEVLTLRFDDVSPGGGNSVDVLLDMIQIGREAASPTRGQILNGSFEEGGLAFWTADVFTYAIGDTSFPIGTDGNTVANLGTFDQPGSVISQNVQVQGGGYNLSFSLGANSPFVGLTASTEVRILNRQGQIIASGIFSVESTGNVGGANGFEEKIFGFRVPQGTKEITVQFLDVSPFNGYTVDVMLDDISLARGRPTPDQFDNADFESGLAGWSHDGNTYAIGDSSFPIGLDGETVANLGTFDQLNSFLSQTTVLRPGRYNFEFAVGANSPNSGAVASVDAQVVTSEGEILASGTFSAVSSGFVSLGENFVRYSLPFSVATRTSSITVLFKDVSPNGGFAVDPMIDSTAIIRVRR